MKKIWIGVLVLIVILLLVAFLFVDVTRIPAYSDWDIIKYNFKFFICEFGCRIGEHENIYKDFGWLSCRFSEESILKGNFYINYHFNWGE